MEKENGFLKEEVETKEYPLPRRTSFPHDPLQTTLVSYGLAYCLAENTSCSENPPKIDAQSVCHVREWFDDQ